MTTKTSKTTKTTDAAGGVTATTETVTETVIRYEPWTRMSGVDTVSQDTGGAVVVTRGYEGPPAQRVPYPEMMPQRERMQSGKPITVTPVDTDIRGMRTFGAR